MGLATAATAISIAIAIAMEFSGVFCSTVRGHGLHHHRLRHPRPTTVFDVIDFGAVGDGITDDTDAFKSAWDSACQASLATVMVPWGRSFLVGPAIFTGPCQGVVTFRIDGTVLAPEDPGSWPANSRRNWLTFYRANGITLQGSGVVDGRGHKWWDLPCKPRKGVIGNTPAGPCDSPMALQFTMSSDVTVRGIRVQNSPKFHFWFEQCHRVTVDHVSISAPALSPNTDGFHVENTQDVGIYNSDIANGDDCISIGGGSRNIHIENVICGPGHGISIGSLGRQNTRACVANVSVRNAVIRHSDNGVRIKTWQGGSGSVTGVTFEGVQVEAVLNPIIIDQYYCLPAGSTCPNQTSAVVVSGIQYRGIKGTYDPRSPPIHFGCSDTVPCTNITLSQVELVPAGDSDGGGGQDPLCWNVYGSLETPTVPPVQCLLHGLPRSILDIDSNMCY